MGKALYAVSRHSLHEQVVRQLGSRILRDEVKPGETLPSEVELCAQFDVSRSVVREALKVLAAKGLVESRTKTGTRVRPRREWNLIDPDVLTWQYEAGPDATYLRNLCEVRLFIEPPAARAAALRATEDEIASIEAWAHRMEIAINDSDPYITADLKFHTAILVAAHNELLLQMGNTVSMALRASRLVTTQVPESSVHAMPQHWAVVRAIQDRDGERAEVMMRDLVATAVADIECALHATTVGKELRDGNSAPSTSGSWAPTG